VDGVTDMEWQLPHWLILAGALLVIASLIGLLMKRGQQAKVQDRTVAAVRSRIRRLTITLIKSDRHRQMGQK